jgi:hypothetical protein
MTDLKSVRDSLDSEIGVIIVNIYLELLLRVTSVISKY